MARLDVKRRKIQAKLVYYGPGLCGKTTNLQYINGKVAKDQELMSLATEGDMTIFFDFMPLDLGKLRGMDIQFKLYTVPGQVRYNQTRKMVLKNVDGIVFVADSQPLMADSNLESLENLFENLAELGMTPDDVPIVLQYNKQDLPGILDRAAMDAQLNRKGYPTMLASAVTGEGVVETLKLATKEILARLTDQLGGVAGAPAPAREPHAPGRRPFRSKIDTKKGMRPAGAVAAEARRTEAQRTEAQRTEAQRTEAQRTEAQKTEAQKIEAQKIDIASERAPAWFELWANERMKHETLIRADLTLTVAGLRRTEASLGKALGEIEALREKVGEGTRSGAAAAEGIPKKLDALGVKIDKVASETGQESILAYVRTMSAKKVAPGGTPTGGLAALATKSDFESLRKAVRDAAAKPRVSAAAVKGAAGEPDLGKLLEKLATKDDLSKLARDSGGPGTVSGKDVGEATKKLGEQMGRLEKLVTRADLNAATKRLSAEFSKGLQGQLAALPKGASPDLGALGKQLAELPTRANIEVLLRSMKSIEKRLANIEIASAAALKNVDAEDTVPKGADAKKVDAKKVDAKKVDAKKVDAKKVDAKKVDAKKADAKKADAKTPYEPADEAETTDARKADAKKADAKKADARKADARKADAKTPYEPADEAETTDTMTPAETAPAERAEAPPDGGEAAVAGDDAEPAEAEAKTSEAGAAPGEVEPDAVAADAKPAGAENAPARSGAPAESGNGKAPAADDKRHKNAARVARVMIADLYLYQKDDVEAGLREGDFEERNKEALSDIQTTYEGRVPKDVRDEFDHVAAELAKAKDKWRKRLNLE